MIPSTCSQPFSFVVRTGNQPISHDFFVVKKLNRNLILDRDWLMQNELRMYFDLRALRIAEKYVALEEDVYITSIIRFVKQIAFKPQCIHTCMTQFTLRNRCGKVYEIEQLNSRYASNRCGVSAVAMVKFNKSRRLSLFVMTNTNHTVTLNRDCCHDLPVHGG